MKKLYLILSFSFLISTAQEKINKVTYKAIIAEKHSEGSNASKDLGMIDEMLKGSEIFFDLTFDNYQAIYYVNNKLDINDSKANMAKIIFGGNNVYYLNSKRREYLSQKDAYGETFLVPISPWDWHLTNETKMIGKYICHKATTIMKVVNSKGTFNHPVTAWFTNEIPVNFGPKGYYGLPGLILELHEGKQIHVAQTISLNKESKDIIVKPTKGIKMTQKEFDEIGMQMDSDRKK